MLLKKIQIIICLFILALPVSAVKKVKTQKINDSDLIATELVSAIDENLVLYIHKNDNSFVDATRRSSRFAMDVSSLMLEDHYPQSVQFEFYDYTKTGSKEIINMTTVTVVNEKKSKDLDIEFEIPEYFTSRDLYIDVYDSRDQKAATFKQHIEIEKPLAGSASSGVSHADCKDSSFVDCLQYILESIRFVAVPNRKLQTKVKKASNDTFIVELPSVKAKKVKIIQSSDSAITTSSSATSTIDFVFQGLNKAYATWNDTLSSIDYIFTNTGESKFRFFDSGKFFSSKLLIGNGTLAEDPEDGLIEFDGEKLYITKAGVRTELGEKGIPGSSGPMGPAGPQGAQGVAGSFSGGDATIDGVLSFSVNGRLQDAIFNGDISIATGAANGYVLSSDANGKATWSSITAVVNGSGASLGAKAVGAAGTVQFSDGSNGLNADASNLFWDDTNNRLGIGINSPDSQLHVSSNASAYVAHSDADELTVQGNSNTGISILNNDVDWSNLYLGTTGRNNASFVSFKSSGAGADWYMNIGTSSQANDPEIRFVTDGVERMRLEGDGHLGLGEDVPTAMLHVGIDSASEQGMILQAASAQSASLTEWQDVNGVSLMTVGAGDKSTEWKNSSGTTEVSIESPSLFSTRKQVFSSGGFAYASNFVNGNHWIQSYTNTPQFSDQPVWHLAKYHLATRNTGNEPKMAYHFANSKLLLGQGAVGYTAGIGHELTSTAPATARVHGNSGSGTDINGGNLEIAAGLPTGAGAGGDLVFQTANGGSAGTSLRDLHERMRITQAGKTVINGSMQILDGNQSNGYVLTSDANGNATWQVSSGGGGASGHGVAGAVQFSDGSNGLNSDASNLFWDDSNGKLGLGTNAPIYDFHISKSKAGSTNSFTLTNTSTSSASDAYINLQGENDTGIRFYSDASSFTNEWTIGNDGVNGGVFSFSTNTNLSFDQKMRITNTGLVQIANTSFGDPLPQAMLEVQSNSASEEGLVVKAASAQTANLTEWQDVNGNVLAKVDKDGTIYADTIGSNYGSYVGVTITGGQQSYFKVTGSNSLSNTWAAMGINSYIASGDTNSGSNPYVFIGSGTTQGLRTDNSQNKFQFNTSTNTFYVGGGPNFSSPNDGYIYGSGASGTDINGANLVIAAGKPTGSGDGGDLIFQTANGSTTGTSQTTLNERMRINQLGNIGVGISSPARKMHISEAMRLEPQSSPPSSAALGDLYVDSDTNELCFYNGSSWIGISAAAACS